MDTWVCSFAVEYNTTMSSRVDIDISIFKTDLEAGEQNFSNYKLSLIYVKLSSQLIYSLRQAKSQRENKVSLFTKYTYTYKHINIDLY